ncbi:MAG: hypothetical protein M0C28_38820 [Candidatus Moduliflexus flocculans]|nr:hypothetical protein [Candidatus Moduliflexus flocculans]
MTERLAPRKVERLPSGAVGLRLRPELHRLGPAEGRGPGGHRGPAPPRRAPPRGRDPQSSGRTRTPRPPTSISSAAAGPRSTSRGSRITASATSR